MEQLTMTEIIDRLKEWDENINIDISSDWPENSERSKMIKQSTSLCMAIGLLQSIGENNNIHQ